MKHIKSINEITSAASVSYAGSGNSTSTGHTGPVAFHAKGSVPGSIPTVGPETPVVYDNEYDMPDYPKAKVKQSFTNDMKGKNRKRAEDDLFGKAKRRVGKLTAHMKKGSSKGMFTDEKERLDAPKEVGGNIKSFSDFTKD